MLAIAILAAGKGTRMVSSMPKVLHKLSGKTLISRVINTCENLNPDKIFIVIGHEANKVKESLSNYKTKIQFVLQEPQNGTGHAIQVLSKELTNFKGNLLVLNGDVPLIETNTLRDLIKSHESENADASVITAEKENPFGYGRVFEKNKIIKKIIEEKDCNNEERLNKMINSGIYCFRWNSLQKIINKLDSNNKQKEIYLTDTISLLKKSITFKLINNDEIEGINNRCQLAKCEEINQERIKTKHMLSGVTFINPSSTTISEDALIGIDVVIESNTHIRGKSIIGNNCTIGPNTFIEDSSVNENSRVINSTVYDSVIMANVCIGPYSHIRPKCQISKNSKVGNFVEIKNSLIEQSTKINHLSYVGDSSIGKFTNIGAGTITANFDGMRKHKTFIGDNCKIGSNTVLIAPINIENNVTIGAGSVINKNVGSNSLGISRVKQINIKNWDK